MEVRQIYYVLEVAKHKSFSKAAQALFITQPSISQQIHTLEAELQIQLFKRTTRNVTLTVEGELFCQKGQMIVDAINDLEMTFNPHFSSNKTVIHLGLFPFYKTIGLDKVVSSYFLDNVNVLGSLKTVDNFAAYKMLEQGELDFAILKILQENIHPEFICEVLLEDSLTLLMSKENPLSSRKEITIDEIAELPMLLGDPDSHYYVEFFNLCKETHAIPAPNIPFYNTLDTDLMLDMIASGKGITLITESAAKQVTGTDLCYIPITPARPTPICLVYQKKKKLTGQFLSFRNYLLRAYQELAEERL